MVEKFQLSEEDWRKRLNSEQFHVMREQGTERPFSGIYWDSKQVGKYACAGCGEALFHSAQKFDSGTGWPSFSQPLRPECVETVVDRSHGMVRTEVHCSRCGSHLGHIFPDGPAPDGLRYCLNSVSLALMPEED